jgi:hypothetical protein
MYNTCTILVLILALRAIAPKLLSATPAMKKYFYNPVDTATNLVLTIVFTIVNAVTTLVKFVVNAVTNLVKFVVDAVTKGVSDAIRWVVRNLIVVLMAGVVLYNIFGPIDIKELILALIASVVIYTIFLRPIELRLDRLSTTISNAI